MKTRTQICKQLQAFLHRLSENTKTAITFCKKKNKKKKIIIREGALDNRAGRKTIRAGRSALRNMPSWNTVIKSAQFPVNARSNFRHSRNAHSCMTPVVAIPAYPVVFMSPNFARQALLLYVDNERTNEPTTCYTATITQYAICPDWELNRGPSGRRTCALTTRPPRLPPPSIGR